MVISPNCQFESATSNIQYRDFIFNDTVPLSFGGNIQGNLSGELRKLTREIFMDSCLVRYSRIAVRGNIHIKLSGVHGKLKGEKFMES